MADHTIQENAIRAAIVPIVIVVSESIFLVRAEREVLMVSLELIEQFKLPSFIHIETRQSGSWLGKYSVLSTPDFVQRGNGRIVVAGDRGDGSPKPIAFGNHFPEVGQVACTSFNP